MLRRTLPSVLVLALGGSFACGGRLRSTQVAEAPASWLEENRQARQLLCSDVGEETCLESCKAEASPREHEECLLGLRFASDPEALRLARALYLGTHALLGVSARESIEGYGGEAVVLFPALPVGEHRHHLQWLHTSLVAFDGFVGELSSRTPKPVEFQPRPKAFVFFKTAEPSYPSAYSWEGVIGYNLHGPLHADPREMHETLFHELFHVNDTRRSTWSISALGAIFDAIVEQCGAEHDCFIPFAPHDTRVPGGTFYAFDERTGDVREYAAELAVRYFLEHEAILSGEAAKLPPFKCVTAENGLAWSRLVDAFFAGVDLSPPCDQSARGPYGPGRGDAPENLVESLPESWPHRRTLAASVKAQPGSADPGSHEP